MLANNKNKPFLYYFSAKTEAFSEPHLQSGIAHDVLYAFIQHYKEFPESKAVLFIVTKVRTSFYLFLFPHCCFPTLSPPSCDSSLHSSFASFLLLVPLPLVLRPVLNTYSIATHPPALPFWIC
jgi:hypothetical protein